MKEMLNVKHPEIYAKMFIDRMPEKPKNVLIYGISDKRTIEIILDNFKNTNFVIADRDANNNLLRYFYHESKKYHYINTFDNENDLNLFDEEGELNDMAKFDIVIMNPPYDGNLHLQILDIVRQQCKEVINISPIRWLQDPLAEYKKSSDYNNFSDLRNSITTLDVVPSTEVHKIFNINWGDLGIYCFNSNKSTFNRNKLVTCPKFIIDFVVSLDDTLDKHNSKEHKGNFIRVPTVYNPSGGNPNNLLFTQDINKCLNVINDKDNIRYFNFKTKTEATNFFNSVHLKLYRYIKKILHETHNTPFNRMPWLVDYTKNWTDQDIYNKFKFSKKQISIIEKEIK